MPKMDYPHFPFDTAPGAAMDSTSFSSLLKRMDTEAIPDLSGATPLEAPHATTILALKHATGVMIAGDRRATEGYSIAHRSIEKVFRTDRWSAVAIAGSAGPAIEMTKLFQTELEHYEKIEGERLSLEGQANKLGQMIRANLMLAMQAGLVVVPLFAGFDDRAGMGRIFKYDVTGGRYEESEYWATGSGGRDARATIKKRYRPGITADDALKVALEALFDASEEDVGTGGPDVLRRIYPNIASITADGFTEYSDGRIAELFQELLQERSKLGQSTEERVPGAERPVVEE
ncbi:MAG TPA: proteasome subunit beta [Actinomycetota bacterium]|nr:proteasome subunit beta [Actinomycetota bacterium]